MSEGDWGPKFAIGGIAALVFASCFALYQNYSLAPRYDSTQGIERQSPDQSACDAQADNYYNCMDLAAQEGMREATDRIAAQGDAQLALGITNLVLLILTLSASIVATFIAARAVGVAREEMENALQPRLGVKFGEMNWDPLKKGMDPSDPGPSLLGDNDGDWTEFCFENHGEAAAYYTMVHIRHYWRDAKDGYPPPIDLLNVKTFETFPEGNWISAAGKSDDWSIFPDKDVSLDPLPTTDDRFWFIMGFVVYEGLHGVRYITRFCSYFDRERRKWMLGEPGGLARHPYNGTQRITRRWFNEMKQARDIAAQY